MHTFFQFEHDVLFIKQHNALHPIPNCRIMLNKPNLLLIQLNNYV